MNANTLKRFKDVGGNVYFAIEWRVIATTVTFIAAFIVSGDIIVSTEIASIEVVAKIIIQSFWLKYRVRKKEHQRESSQQA